MKPIWYFVGLILMAIGFVILANGVYLLYNPPVIKTVLSETQPSLWWGSIMIVFGSILYFANAKKIVE